MAAGAVAAAVPAPRGEAGVQGLELQRLLGLLRHERARDDHGHALRSYDLELDLPSHLVVAGNLRHAEQDHDRVQQPPGPRHATQRVI